MQNNKLSRMPFLDAPFIKWNLWSLWKGQKNLLFYWRSCFIDNSLLYRYANKETLSFFTSWYYLVIKLKWKYIFLKIFSFPECLLTCNNEVCKCGSYDVEANIAMEIRVSKIHLNILIHIWYIIVSTEIINKLLTFVLFIGRYHSWKGANWQCEHWWGFWIMTLMFLPNLLFITWFILARRNKLLNKDTWFKVFIAGNVQFVTLIR